MTHKLSEAELSTQLAKTIPNPLLRYRIAEMFVKNEVEKEKHKIFLADTKEKQPNILEKAKAFYVEVLKKLESTEFGRPTLQAVQIIRVKTLGFQKSYAARVLKKLKRDERLKEIENDEKLKHLSTARKQEILKDQEWEDEKNSPREAYSSPDPTEEDKDVARKIDYIQSLMDVPIPITESFIRQQIIDVDRANAIDVKRLKDAAEFATEKLHPLPNINKILEQMPSEPSTENKMKLYALWEYAKIEHARTDSQKFSPQFMDLLTKRKEMEDVRSNLEKLKKEIKPKHDTESAKEKKNDIKDSKSPDASIRKHKPRSFSA